MNYTGLRIINLKTEYLHLTGTGFVWREEKEGRYIFDDYESAHAEASKDHGIATPLDEASPPPPVKPKPEPPKPSSPPIAQDWMSRWERQHES